MRVVLLAEPSVESHRLVSQQARQNRESGLNHTGRCQILAPAENICTETEAGKLLVVRMRNTTVLIHVEAPADP